MSLYITWKMSSIRQEPVEYSKYICPGSPTEGPFQQFKVKLEGKHYVDGRYTNDFVQYL